MKECCKCKLVMTFDSFHKESRRKDGFCSHCKECEKKRLKDRISKDIDGYRKTKRENARKHAEKRNAKAKIRYQENKEEYLSKRREQYQRDRDKIRARQNELHKTPEYKEKANERQKKWAKKNRAEYRKIQRKWIASNKKTVYRLHNEWRKKNRDKYNATQQVRDHVRRGTMTRPSNCEICLKSCKPEGHHDDYMKPLEVKWLCRTCHLHQHNKLMDVKP